MNEWKMNGFDYQISKYGKLHLRNTLNQKAVRNGTRTVN